MTETPETKETHRIAISNQKGGAGKTTDTIHLAGALADRGYSVLCVDMDYHGGLTCSLGYSERYYDLSRDVTLYEVLTDPELVNSSSDLIIDGEEFDLLPSTERLANTSNVQDLSNSSRSTERLDLALNELEQTRDYDYILIDTPPALNVLTDNALVAAGNVIIPILPEKLNQNSLRLLRKQLDGLEKWHGDIREIAIVANRVEQNKEHKQTVEEVRENFPIPTIAVPKRTDLSRSVSEHVSIFRYERENKRVESARDCFRELADIVEEAFSDDSEGGSE